MTRPSRMLLVVSVMAVASVVVLWMLASRYRRMEPRRSVHELQVAPPDGTLVGTEPNLPPEPGESQTTVESTDPTVPAELRSRMEAFITVRRGVKSILEEHPAAKRWVDPDTGKLLTELDFRNTKLRAQLLGKVKMRQVELFHETGITGEEYGRVREVFRAWVKGGREEKDPLESAFEIRREELESLYLGLMEPFDL